MNRSHKTKYALLGMLSQRPMSGYDIKKALQTSTNFFWQESDGQIYPALAKLLADKSIICLAAKANEVRARKVYKITAKGLKELKEWLNKDPVPTIPRNELLLKLFFGLNVPTQINRKHILEHQQMLVKRLAIFKKIEKDLSNDNSPHLPYWQLTLKFGEYITQAQLDWCEEALKKLSK